MLDFGTPLPPSCVPKWHPKSLKYRQKAQKKHPGRSLFVVLENDLLPISLLERSWAPFWSIWDGFWMNFNGFWYHFSMHFRFVCNKICRLPKKSLGEKSCIPGPFLGVYFCSFSESLEKVKQDQIRSNKINQDQTRSIKRTLGINRHAQFATMEHRSPSSKLRGRAVTRRMAS